MQNIISVKHLFKTFKNVPVLKDINLDIAPGKRIVITGPSGSGKSTLLRCLNLLETPTEGDILEKLANKKLVIFVSHRMYFSKTATKIIYIENGEIKNIGAHNELMKNCLGYKELFEEQANRY